MRQLARVRQPAARHRLSLPPPTLPRPSPGVSRTLRAKSASPPPHNRRGCDACKPGSQQAGPHAGITPRCLRSRPGSLACPLALTAPLARPRRHSPQPARSCSAALGLVALRAAPPVPTAPGKKHLPGSRLPPLALGSPTHSASPAPPGPRQTTASICLTFQTEPNAPPNGGTACHRGSEDQRTGTQT